MRRAFASGVLCAGVALALGTGCSSQPASNGEGDEITGAQTAPVEGQERVAETTAALTDAIAAQLGQGTIDRAALAGPIARVVESSPEEARPEVQADIQDTLADAEDLASQMSPEQRADVAAHPEHVAAVSEAVYRGRRGAGRGWGRPLWGRRWGRGRVCSAADPWCRRRMWWR
jgi:hypothetical protein